VNYSLLATKIKLYNKSSISEVMKKLIISAVCLLVLIAGCWQLCLSHNFYIFVV